MKLDFIKKAITKLYKRFSFIETNYNQPKQIDGKVNGCYVYEISEDTEVEIVDDLRAVETGGPIIYDIYWQNTDDTSELTFSFDGSPIILDGDFNDLTTQNHIIFVRHPKSTSNGIKSILECTNKTMGAKRSNIVIINETAPSVSSATVEDADPDALIVVFDKAVTGDLTDWSIVSDGDAISIDSLTSGSGTNTYTIALSREVVNGETLTVTWGASNTIVTSGTLLGLVASSKVVDNNVIIGIGKTPITFADIAQFTQNGEEYTGLTNGWNVSTAVSNQSFASTDFAIEMNVESSSNYGTMLALDALTSVITSYGDYDFAIFISPLGDINYLVGSSPTIIKSVTPSASYRVALRCVGGNLYLSETFDAGLSYSNIHDFGAYSGSRRMHMQANNSGTGVGIVNKPRYTGN